MDDCLDWIFNTFDELCWSSQFETIDQILKYTDIYDTKITILIGLLTITACVKSKLKYREDFYNKIKQRLQKQNLNFQLIEGLE